jgi:hypothetical protein
MSDEPPLVDRSAETVGGVGATDNERRISERAIPEGAGSEGAMSGRPIPETVDTSRVTETRRAKPTELDSLFDHEAAADFRSRWDVVQRGFVDDPQQAVRDGDQLVTQVIQMLSSSFAEQRTAWEGDGGAGEPSTENLRQALRRYRSFFDRLLAV